MCGSQYIAAAPAQDAGNPADFIADPVRCGIRQALLGGYSAPEGKILAIEPFQFRNIINLRLKGLITLQSDFD